MVEQIRQSVLYLYDLPVGRVTSVMIADVIKRYTGYVLKDPVQFHQRMLPNGLVSPFCTAFCKIDPSQLAMVAAKMKYF